MPLLVERDYGPWLHLRRFKPHLVFDISLRIDQELQPRQVRGVTVMVYMPRVVVPAPGRPGSHDDKTSASLPS